VSRCKIVSRCKSWIAVAAIVVLAVALAAVALPQKAEAATLKGKLRAARLALRQSKERLKTAEIALAEAVTLAGAALGSAEATAEPPAADAPDEPATEPVSLASPPPSAQCLDVLEAKVVRARRALRAWTRRVHKLARQYRLQRNLAEWERRGDWRPIIEVAARRYHVSAGGIYRMMMRESGGQRFAGTASAFKGLFQYCLGTWSAAWNPWRHDSIYDGSSQIFATAYAIHKGMGPQMWTTTFASQY